MASQVIVTMAGFGRRFLDAGYDRPKYMVEVHGRSLFAWSLLSLQSFLEAGADLTFVVREADRASDFIVRELRALNVVGAFRITELSAPTDGQATSALLGGVERLQEPMVIYNIDTFVHPKALPASAARGDGWIPCFPGEGAGWSFALADEDGRVREVREKQRISNDATVGLYWFSSVRIYEQTYRDHYGGGTNLEKGEAYVAPLYNRLIADGGEVYLHRVPKAAVIPLGTPEEVERFARGAPPRL